MPRKPNDPNKLTKRQKQFLKARLDGHTLQQVAAMYGVTKQYVWHRLRGVSPSSVSCQRNCSLCGTQYVCESIRKVRRCPKCAELGSNIDMCECGEYKSKRAAKCMKCANKARCPDEQCIECIRIMYDAGIPMNLIARVIRMHPQTVWRYVTKLCIVTRRRGEHTGWDLADARTFLQKLLETKGWKLAPTYL